MDAADDEDDVDDAVDVDDDDGGKDEGRVECSKVGGKHMKGDTPPTPRNHYLTVVVCTHSVSQTQIHTDTQTHRHTYIHIDRHSDTQEGNI